MASLNTRLWTKGTRTGVVALVAATCVALGSCDSTDPPDTSNFSIAPGTATILVGGNQQLTAIGAPGPVEWSSSNSSVATVVRETGFVTGVARGTATINALSGGVVKTAAITVEIEPAIALSTPELEFTRLEGANEDPPTQTVQITNAGDRSLNDLSLGTPTYSGGPATGGQLQDPDWLLPTLAGNTAPTSLDVFINGIALPRGTYTAALPILSSVATNSPQSLLVTFRVQAPPTIVADPNPVQVTAIPNEVSTSTVSITNGGDVALTGLATSIGYQGATGWLTATLDSPDAPASLSLTANSSGLAVGTYNATVRISSNIQGVAPLDLPVEFVVTPGPAITLGTSNVSFNAVQGSSPSSQTVNITNGGGGTLSGLAASVTSGGSWLSATMNSGTAPTSVTLSVNSSSLTNGTYNGSVQIASGVASNSPRTINVTLTIGPPPSIALNPSSLRFSSFQGASIQPSPQSVSVTNSGGGTVTNLTASVTYSGSGGWLVPIFTGGTSAPTTLSVQVNTGSLAEGTYSATLTVQSPGVPSQSIPVTFRVQSFTTHISGLFGGCTGSSCHNTNNPVLNVGASAMHTNLLNEVVPGNPNVGDLICKITNVSMGSCTATGGMTMSAQAIDSIRAWISRGAPFN